LTARGDFAAAFSTFLAACFVPSALLKFFQPAKRYIIGSSSEESPIRIEKKTGAFASASR